MKDLGVWDCRDGTHDAIQAFYGRIVSHLHLMERRVNVRFTDQSTLKFTVLEGEPGFMAVQVLMGAMDSTISAHLDPTNHPELARFIGTEFTGFNENRLEFGEWSIQLERDQIILLKWAGTPRASVN